jgi:hypothetical protein
MGISRGNRAHDLDHVNVDADFWGSVGWELWQGRFRMTLWIMREQRSANAMPARSD